MKYLIIFIFCILSSSSFARIYLSDNNQVTFLSTGEELNQRRLKVIQEAEVFIYIKTFIINRDETERAVYETLCEKAEKGLDVRILVDAIGRTQGGNPVKKRRGHFSINWFKSCGIKFEEYGKLSWGPLPFILYNQHDKLMVSEKEAIIGGANFSKDYSTHGFHSPHWYDFDISLSGNSVCEIRDIFNQSWTRAYEREFRGIKRLSSRKRRSKVYERFLPDTLSQICHPDLNRGSESVTVLYNDPLYFSDRPFLNYFLKSLDKMIEEKSQETVDLYAPYFIPSWPLMNKLIEAKEAGIEVRIITNSKSSIDKNAFGAYAAMLFKVAPLLFYGVKIYLWTPSLYPESHLSNDNVFHKKGGCFGLDSCFVGSHNLDLRGDKYSTELIAILHDENTIQALKKNYNQDLLFTTEMTIFERKNLIKRAGLTQKIVALIAGWAM
jgi:cardiolipin synthase